MQDQLAIAILASAAIGLTILLMRLDARAIARNHKEDIEDD